METAAIIAIIEGAFTIIEKVTPALQQAFQKGEVTAEQQTALLAKVEALRSATAFSGPGWEIDPPEQPPLIVP